MSALQFLVSSFIRISEKNFLAYLPYSRGFLSLRRMKEQSKNPFLFNESAPEKAAKAAGEKSVSMLAQKQLFPLTGYIHGGCSPIGMKKNFDTFAHFTAENFDTIFFSAGKIGRQIEMSLGDLNKIKPVKPADLVR